MAWHIFIVIQIVPNDGNRIEIDEPTFNVASAFHVSGHVIQFTDNKLPVVLKKY